MASERPQKAKREKQGRVRPVIKVLEGWEGLPAAAARLGTTRQRLFQMGTEEGKLSSLRQIPGAGERPTAYVVSTKEIDALIAKRQEIDAARERGEASVEEDPVAVGA